MDLYTCAYELTLSLIPVPDFYIILRLFINIGYDPILLIKLTCFFVIFALFNSS